MPTVALFGAGGKMGLTVTDKIKDSEFDMRYVEIGARGIEELKKRGLTVTPENDALKVADAVILAVPDALMEKIWTGIVPKMRSGALLITLDAAVPLDRGFPKRADVAYFVTHPTHKSALWKKKTPGQSLVSALVQGTDKDYALGEKIGKAMHAPIGDSYRVTLEQMALLEPALAESLALSVSQVLREAVEAVIAQGVPPGAAWDFAIGHVGGNIQCYLQPEIQGWRSEGALTMLDWGMKKVFRDDWKYVLTPEGVREQARVIAAGKSPSRK